MNKKRNAVLLVFSLLLGVIILGNNYYVAFAYESADSTTASNEKIIAGELNGKLLVKSEEKQQKENEQWTEEREYEYPREGDVDYKIKKKLDDGVYNREEEGDGKYKPTKKAGGQSDKSIVYPNRGSAYKRCLETQNRREKECKGEAECLENVEYTKNVVCKDINRQLSQPQAISCTGMCAIQTCTVQNPCTIKPPKGPRAICTAGTKCANVGDICDPGTVCDCVCTQTYHPAFATCKCGCEW